jgi:hypothetical protein
MRRKIEIYFLTIGNLFGRSLFSLMMWCGLLYLFLGIGFPKLMPFLDPRDSNFYLELTSLIGVFSGITIAIHKNARSVLQARLKKENFENSVYQILTKLSENLFDLYVEIPTFLMQKLDPDHSDVLGSKFSGWGCPVFNKGIFDLVERQSLLEVDNPKFKADMAQLINYCNDLCNLSENQKQSWHHLTATSTVPISALVHAHVYSELQESCGHLEPYPDLFTAIEDFVKAAIDFRSRVYETIAFIESMLRYVLDQQLNDSSSPKRNLLAYLNQQANWMKSVTEFDNKSPMRFCQKQLTLVVNREIEKNRVERLNTLLNREKPRAVG